MWERGSISWAPRQPGLAILLFQKGSLTNGTPGVLRAMVASAAEAAACPSNCLMELGSQSHGDQGSNCSHLSLLWFLFLSIRFDTLEIELYTWLLAQSNVSANESLLRKWPPPQTQSVNNGTSDPPGTGICPDPAGDLIKENDTSILYPCRQAQGLSRRNISILFIFSSYGLGNDSLCPLGTHRRVPPAIEDELGNAGS